MNAFHKPPTRMILAMSRYYQNRKAARNANAAWDKQADLDNIEHSRSKNCTSFVAISGTFWFGWASPTCITRHDEGDYSLGRITHRLRRGKMVEVKP